MVWENVRNSFYLFNNLLFIKIVLSIRKTDILNRRRKVSLIKEEIQRKLKEKEEREIEKQAELEKEKENAERDEVEFNEEEFELKFLEKYPEIIVSLSY